MQNSEHRNRINKSSESQDLPSPTPECRLGTQVASLSFTLHCIAIKKSPFSYLKMNCRNSRFLRAS